MEENTTPQGMTDDEYDRLEFRSVYNNFLYLLQLMEERKMSEYDARCFLASKVIEDWMKDPDNAEFIRDKQKQYIHDKGWAKNKMFKEEYTIPQEAYLVLPEELRKDQKRLQRWVKDNHRYLIFK